MPPSVFEFLFGTNFIAPNQGLTRSNDTRFSIFRQTFNDHHQKKCFVFMPTPVFRLLVGRTSVALNHCIYHLKGFRHAPKCPPESRGSKLGIFLRTLRACLRRGFSPPPCHPGGASAGARRYPRLFVEDKVPLCNGRFSDGTFAVRTLSGDSMTNRRVSLGLYSGRDSLIPSGVFL